MREYLKETGWERYPEYFKDHGEKGVGCRCDYHNIHEVWSRRPKEKADE